MNAVRTLLSILLLFALSAGSVKAEPAPAKDTRPVALEFEKLKGLAGQWEGRAPDGTVGVSTIKVASNGSAVVEEMGHGSMITVYHLDGDRLMCTHYCAAMNQPRMRTQPITTLQNPLKFDFLDVTNLKTPDAGYMKSVEIKFKDDDHFSAIWTYSEKGKTAPMEIVYTRKK